jgi:hypothetical protein
LQCPPASESATWAIWSFVVDAKNTASISCKVAIQDTGDATVPNANPSKLAIAKLSEKDAWQRYAEAKGDNWPEAFAKWVEARDASLAAWADEVGSRHR